ncbi:MAG TPA: hypothetical protein VG900_00150 [Hyphomicrobiaceae bacterium]|jgi:hypothetical protein|nr:hypothetical protein [Hyphomicrobiaceae bacterium]
MKLKDLPIDTWMVVEGLNDQNNLNVLSTHTCQREAEAERDRRNSSNAGMRRCAAVIALQPIAERMGPRRT